MDEAKKKPMLIGIIVVCLSVVAAMFFVTRPGKRGIPDDFKKETIFLLCRNSSCKAFFETNKYAYYKFGEDYVKANLGSSVPLFKCEKCGQESCVEGVKCAKCGQIFEMRWKRGAFADQCPKCGYSKIKEEREKNAAGTAGE
jgi:DNA-directed RNA polymerase subunit M/transcription elongation factor TFIIS